MPLWNGETWTCRTCDFVNAVIRIRCRNCGKAAPTRDPAPRKLDGAKLVADWNRQNPIGIKVAMTKDDGSVHLTTTRSQAELLSGHTPVIWLDGVRGCYLLDRVKPFTD